MDWTQPGIILASVGLAFAAIFGIVQIYLSLRGKQAMTKLGDGVAENLITLGKLGDAVAADLTTLGKVTASDLTKLGEVTLKAIEGAHKSIKEELIKEELRESGTSKTKS